MGPNSVLIFYPFSPQSQKSGGLSSDGMCTLPLCFKRGYGGKKAED